MKKLCKCCGVEFNALKTKQKYCSRKCGKNEIRIDKILRKCELSGCTNSFECYPSSKQFLCSRECQVKWQKENMCGENNPNYGNRKPNMFKHTEEAKKTIKEKVKESWKKEDRLIKHLNFIDRHRCDDGSMDWHTKEYREKISLSNITRLKNNEPYFAYKSCVKGYILNLKTNENEFFHSSWEMNKMIELNENNDVIFWTKKHGIHILYFYKSSVRNYLPDFYVEYKNGIKRLEEIKGYIEDEEQHKLKIIAAREYCKENGLEYMIDYVENKKIYKHLIEWEEKLN
jgi:hypothetical protein